MKYLVILLVLFSGCDSGPKFKVGDCIQDADERENWEQVGIERVLEIGKWSYRVELWNDRYKHWFPTSLPTVFSLDYRKVECPQ